MSLLDRKHFERKLIPCLPRASDVEMLHAVLTFDDRARVRFVTNDAFRRESLQRDAADAFDGLIRAAIAESKLLMPHGAQQMNIADGISVSCLGSSREMDKLEALGRLQHVEGRQSGLVSFCWFLVNGRAENTARMLRKRASIVVKNLLKGADCTDLCDSFPFRGKIAHVAKPIVLVAFRP